ncbi:RNA polymerase sigma factor [Corynebacterium sp. J010B-136]|uniref:RNA polymerase sigma factor n=1 Tax=Corynebacterium sp. J010B-136 TaxID=2099401 RepID=UPI000CFA759B|nr:sigma-70 family RNA polymerase sigma factor [Corynebacterium sp. J010B-136]PQM74378.1 RNA polymerase subunit sigma-24 [Corynebacterium sp. J010B-136]
MNLPFEQAVATHGETVLRVCRAVLGPGSDADYDWSETFLAALKAWPELDENTNVEAWLVRVAHRKAIDITRQQSRRARMVSPAPPEELQDYEKAVEASISNCDIWELVAALPLRQRQAIAYHYLGGLSYREAAELLDSNADAVRRAAADGMKKLRKSYRHD